MRIAVIGEQDLVEPAPDLDRTPHVPTQVTERGTHAMEQRIQTLQCRETIGLEQR